MKRFAGFTIMLMFSTNSFAANELLLNNMPLTLIMSDHNQARVSSCSEFIALRQSGERVNELPELNDPDYREAKGKLLECYLDAYSIAHGQIKVPSENPPDITVVINHFPASTALAVSDEAINMIDEKFTGKTIKDYTPDIHRQDNRMISFTGDVGYFIGGSEIFKDKEGKLTNYITLNSFSLHGSLVTSNTYRIISDKGPVWAVEKITENSPL